MEQLSIIRLEERKKKDDRKALLTPLEEEEKLDSRCDAADVRTDRGELDKECM